MFLGQCNKGLQDRKKVDIDIENLHIFNVFNNYYIYGTNSNNIYKIKEERVKGKIEEFQEKEIDLGFLKSYLPEITLLIKKEKQYYKKKIKKAAEKNICSFSDKKNRKTSLLTLVVANSCNLNCKYCYLKDRLKENELMTWDIAKKSIDFFFAHSEDNDKLEISYFGGEPLLNFNVIEKATRYTSSITKAKDKKIYFKFVTNGTIVNQKIVDFLKEFGFAFGISLNGPKLIHNSLRVFRNDKGTYDKILRNVANYFSQISLSNHNLIKFHVVIHHPFYKHVSQIYDFFHDLENKYGISFLRFSKIDMVDHKEPFKDTLSHFNEYINMLHIYFKKVLEECISSNSLVPIYKKGRIELEFLDLLEKKESVAKSLCGSGINTFMVYPNGEISGCRQLDPVFYPNAIWGNINTLKIDEKLRLEPYKSSLKSLDICNQCWLNNLCSGSCPAMNYYYTGKTYTPDYYSCEIKKTIFKLSVWLKDKLKEGELWKKRKISTTKI